MCSYDLFLCAFVESPKYLSNMFGHDILIDIGSVFKDGGKEEKKKNPTSSPVKCFFVCVHSDALIDQNSSYILYRKPMHERRYPFMHVHTVSSVSNYIARYVFM